MPGISYSINSSASADFAWRFERAIDWLRHVEGYVTERFSEPGFELACVYAPQVCSGPRLLVTPDYVLAAYGNVHDDSLIGVHGIDLCQRLLMRYRAKGLDALKHLNGRYDIVVWNRPSRVLQHVSDRYGANRHYLHRRADALHVACEVKALAPWLDAIEINPVALGSMLSYGYHLGDLTLLKGVECLPNARVLEYEAGSGRLQLARYWNYPYGESDPLQGSADELAEALHAHLAKAMTRQLRGVDKLLLPLSGGLDSRTVAGVLKQSGYSGDVLAYSYGQRSSQDVRIGRALARTLGYRHVHVPTPADFMTRHLEQAAWQFDAEWPADANWGTRFAVTHPALGDTQGYAVLSGFHGDITLGSDLYRYRTRAGDQPLPPERLVELFNACIRDMPIDGLFDAQMRAAIERQLTRLLAATFAPVATGVPFIAMLRAEFVHRQRRHTATVPQSMAYTHAMLTPFLDTDLVDFSTRIPLAHFYDRKLVCHMLRTRLPSVASIPYALTGLPLSEAPVRAALKWRLDRVLKHFPALQRWQARRNAFFDFRGGILAQAGYFRERLPVLAELAPPLDATAARGRVNDLLRGQQRGVEQITALFPPAIFLRELKRRLADLRAG